MQYEVGDVVQVDGYLGNGIIMNFHIDKTYDVVESKNSGDGWFVFNIPFDDLILIKKKNGKFKLGDEVIVIDGEAHCLNRVGTISYICGEIEFGDCSKKCLYKVDFGECYPYDIYEDALELYEEKKEEKIDENKATQRILDKFGVTMNDLKNNDLLCLSLVALLFSQDGAKIFKEIWEERKMNK